MTTDVRFVVVRRDGIDTLHRNPREECNTDDAASKQLVDPDTAAALLTLGQARRCSHCNQED